MKHINNSAILLITTIFFTSCKKDKTEPSQLASLNVTNVVVGGTTARLGSNATNITNNSYAQLALVAGYNDLYLWPLGDSSHPYFTSPKFIAEERAVYSIFLTGTSASPEGFMVKENIPYYTDSITGIRFINLSPNTSSKPLFITMASAPSVIDVNNLAYKKYNDFKSYPGLYNSSYTFQIRNDTCAAPKNPLTTFTLFASSLPRFSNVTLVIRQNGVTGVKVLKVNNDK